ncbi:MAG: hypothetical protein KAU99_02160 [Thermoplasmata archaeon]|nr:hypothetical protein [Thermoplasmata archaeon]
MSKAPHIKTGVDVLNRSPYREILSLMLTLGPLNQEDIRLALKHKPSNGLQTRMENPYASKVWEGISEGKSRLMEVIRFEVPKTIDLEPASLYQYLTTMRNLELIERERKSPRAPWVYWVSDYFAPAYQLVLKQSDRLQNSDPDQVEVHPFEHVVLYSGSPYELSPKLAKGVQTAMTIIQKVSQHIWNCQWESINQALKKRVGVIEESSLPSRIKRLVSTIFYETRGNLCHMYSLWDEYSGAEHMETETIIARFEDDPELWAEFEKDMEVMSIPITNKSPEESREIQELHEWAAANIPEIRRAVGYNKILWEQIQEMTFSIGETTEPSKDDETVADDEDSEEEIRISWLLRRFFGDLGEWTIEAFHTIDSETSDKNAMEKGLDLTEGELSGLYDYFEGHGVSVETLDDLKSLYQLIGRDFDPHIVIGPQRPNHSVSHIFVELEKALRSHARDDDENLFDSLLRQAREGRGWYRLGTLSSKVRALIAKR